MNSKRAVFISILALIIISTSAFLWYKNTVGTTSASSSSTPSSQNNRSDLSKPSVVTSFYPLYEFTKQIGADKINVENITPAGVEPHDFEPSNQQIAKIQDSKIFIYNGGGVDAWAEKLAPELGKKGVKVIKMTDILQSDLISTQEDSNNNFDPHFWLDPILVQKEADSIAQNLIEVDSGNSESYKTNLEKFKQQLSDLNNNYKSGLSNCSIKTVVVSHNAFGYLAKRYNFEILPISGFNPEAEPSLEKISEIIKLVKEKKIKFIAFESLVSPKISQTIANETGASTIVLNPIEGLAQEEIDNNQNYLSLMQDNLNNLRSVLDCK